MKIFKDIRFYLVLLLIVSLVAGGLLYYSERQNKEAIAAEKDAQISELNEKLTAIGELVPAYTVATNVETNKKIEDTDLVEISVPISMSTNLLLDKESVIGKYFKVDMTEGSVITNDCIYEDEITSDMRYYDMMVDILPIGLKAGSIVDLRIKFGTGADYVVLPHIRIIEINGNCLKVVLKEEDIHMFSSLIVDNIVFNKDFKVKYLQEKDRDGNGKIDEKDLFADIKAVGCYTYVVEYVEGGTQNKAASYYSPSAIVQAIMQNDPNIFKNVENPQDKALVRKFIEAGILSGTDKDIDTLEFSKTAENIRTEVDKFINQGRTDYEKRVQEEMKAAEEAAKAAEAGM